MKEDMQKVVFTDYGARDEVRWRQMIHYDDP